MNDPLESANEKLKYIEETHLHHILTNQPGIVHRDLLWLISRVKILTEVAQAVCDDWDLNCEDDNGKIDKLRKVLAGDRTGEK